MNELKSRVSSALRPPVRAQRRAVPKEFFCTDKKLIQSFVVVQIICRCADHLHENPFHGLCTSSGILTTWHIPWPSYTVIYPHMTGIWPHIPCPVIWAHIPGIWGYILFTKVYDSIYLVYEGIYFSLKVYDVIWRYRFWATYHGIWRFMEVYVVIWPWPSYDSFIRVWLVFF